MKTGIQDLAIFGGRPEFADKLHVGRPNIGNPESLSKRLNKILESKWLTNNGPYVREFETATAQLLGVKNCIATCNATVAMEIAIRALDLSGEVIVPSFTFVATPHALQWHGITPVFCDIQPNTHSIDPNCVKTLITSRTTGIIGVHLWGKPCEIEALTRIAEDHKLRLLFDAAHAFGCSHKGRMIGSFGELEVFSFHATKFLNTFEGGMVATNNDHLAEKIRLMCNYGSAGYDNVISIGTNGKMNEVAAAMGLTGLESFDEFLTANLQNYLAYQRQLAGLPGIRFIGHDKREKSNHQYVVVEINEQETQIGRDQLLKILWAENVLARRYFYPGCHRMEPYRSYLRHVDLLLPETEQACKRVLVLPTGTAVSVEDVSAICGIIRLTLANARAVVSLLAKRTGHEIAARVSA
jgi:dTDP-4-amino-4,6-dideoxygalactose transaminase